MLQFLDFAALAPLRTFKGFFYCFLTFFTAFFLQQLNVLSFNSLVLIN